MRTKYASVVGTRDHQKQISFPTILFEKEACEGGKKKDEKMDAFLNKQKVGKGDDLFTE